MDSQTIRVPARALRLGPGAHDVHSASWAAAPSAGEHPQGHPLVCVHGLGGSHLNWGLAAPLLAGLPGVTDRVWAPDLPGFGLTSPASPDGGVRGATLAESLDLLVGYVQTVSPDRPVLLMGNSMGGLLALLLAAQRPELVAGLVLINPALPTPLGTRLDPQVVANFALFALPGVGERVLALRQRRLTPEAQVAQTMALCAADPDALDAALLAEHAMLAAQRRAMPWAHRAFLQASRDIVRTVTVGRGRVWDAVARVSAPTLYVQGVQDRLVHHSAGALLVRHRPDWTHARYDDLGHVPMVEDAPRLARDVDAWLQASVRSAVA
jgi:pimeloyl-ACP methyl ester carboxylesterase